MREDPMTRRSSGGLLLAILLPLGVGFFTACSPSVGPNRREVTVTGTVYFDLVPDSGWSVSLQGPSRPTGVGFCFGWCGGGGYVHEGDATSGTDGTFTITAEVEEDSCGSMWLALMDRPDKPHTLSLEGRPERHIQCGFASGYDFIVESGWPWEQG
jgi:hypothetical protein